MSAQYNLCIFLLLSFQCEGQMNGHAGSISRHFLLLSITVISGQLHSRVLSVCTGKSHKIVQSSDSKTFPGLCMYHFSALLNSYFSHDFQCIIWATLFCLFCLFSFCASFEHSDTICATVSSVTRHTQQMD